MKVAYLMLVHANPRLLKRAIGTLSSGDCAFFIHVDGKTDLEEFSAVRGDSVFFCEQRIPAYWGEFSLVDATFLLIREALKQPTGYEYFVLLSGSDYPLRSGDYIRRFLTNNNGLEFMSVTKMPAPGYPLSKINKLRYPSDKPVRRFVSRALAKLGFFERDYQKCLKGLTPYAGSQWWAITRDAAQYILEFVRLNPHVEEYFRNAFTADEMFFQTILGNSPLSSRLRRNLVYVDWPTPGNHPALLREDHLRLFASQQKVWVDDEWGSGEVLFARKFSDDNLQLLDGMDQMIRRKEAQVAIPIPSVNA
jgi:Core-2/I-Branching enzyme